MVNVKQDIHSNEYEVTHITYNKRNLGAPLMNHRYVEKQEVGWRAFSLQAHLTIFHT